MSIAVAWFSHLGYGSPVMSAMRHGPSPTCLLCSSPFPSPAAPYRPAARFPTVSSLRPVLRVDERGAISCLPCLSSSLSVAVFMRVRCHERRDEMMSRPLRACFLSFFLSPFSLFPALIGLPALACPPPAGRGMCGLAINLRLRAWRDGLSARSDAVALSLPLVRYSPPNRYQVCLSAFLPFPSYQMSDELVKTAPAFNFNKYIQLQFHFVIR